MAAVPLPDWRTLLATDNQDRTVRLWDPATTGKQDGEVSIGESIEGMCRAQLMLIVTAGVSVRLCDSEALTRTAPPVARRPSGPPTATATSTPTGPGCSCQPAA